MFLSYIRKLASRFNFCKNAVALDTNVFYLICLADCYLSLTGRTQALLFSFNNFSFPLSLPGGRVADLSLLKIPSSFLLQMEHQLTEIQFFLAVVFRIVSHNLHRWFI